MMDPALGNGLLQEIVHVGREKFQTGCHVYWLTVLLVAVDHAFVQAPGVLCGSGGRPRKQRLQSRTEISRHPKNGAPKQRSCGFCFKDRHTVSQCPLIGQRGKQVLHTDKDQFCYGILDTFAVKQLNHQQHPSPNILSNLVGATHIAIINLHVAARNAVTSVVNRKNNREMPIGVQQVIAKVTLLGEGGNPLTGVSAQLSTDNDFYTLASVLSWISKASTKRRVFHSLTQLSKVDNFQFQHIN